MAWIVREKETPQNLVVFENKPQRDKMSMFNSAFDRYEVDVWIDMASDAVYGIDIPSDADEKLIGKHITWEDEPVEI